MCSYFLILSLRHCYAIPCYFPSTSRGTIAGYFIPPRRPATPCDPLRIPANPARIFRLSRVTSVMAAAAHPLPESSRYYPVIASFSAKRPSYAENEIKPERVLVRRDPTRRRAEMFAAFSVIRCRTSATQRAATKGVKRVATRAGIVVALRIDDDLLKVYSSYARDARTLQQQRDNFLTPKTFLAERDRKEYF